MIAAGLTTLRIPGSPSSRRGAESAPAARPAPRRAAGLPLRRALLLALQQAGHHALTERHLWPADATGNPLIWALGAALERDVLLLADGQARIPLGAPPRRLLLVSRPDGSIDLQHAVGATRTARASVVLLAAPRQPSEDVLDALLAAGATVILDESAASGGNGLAWLPGRPRLLVYRPLPPHLAAAHRPADAAYLAGDPTCLAMIAYHPRVQLDRAARGWPGPVAH